MLKVSTVISQSTKPNFDAQGKLIDTQVSEKHKHIVAESAEDWQLLQEVFHRATNLWPDAPPQVKTLADLVISGQVFQDYSRQDTSPKKGVSK